MLILLFQQLYIRTETHKHIYLKVVKEASNGQHAIQVELNLCARMR